MYSLGFTNGRFDEDFHARVRRIGTIHARIGLEPRWYMGGYALMLEELVRSVSYALSPLRRALSLFRLPNAAEASIAISKAALFDIEISVSIYVDEVQNKCKHMITGPRTVIFVISNSTLTAYLMGPLLIRILNV